MNFQFDECVNILFKGLFESLVLRADDICLLNKTEPIWAIAYDLIPWDPYVGIAFRLESESGFDASDNSADWKHSHFIEATHPALKRVEEYIFQTSEASLRDDTCEPEDITHMIFLAGAAALLDQRIAQFLRSLGVDAPVISNQVVTHSGFRYVVLDEDGMVRANYCEIVRASRITQRLLGRSV